MNTTTLDLASEFVRAVRPFALLLHEAGVPWDEAVNLAAEIFVGGMRYLSAQIDVGDQAA